VTLNTDSRFWATPGTLKTKLVKAPEGWFYEPATVSDNTGEGRVDTDILLWAALRNAGPEGITYEEIDALPGLSRDKAKKRFPAWRSKGTIDHHGDGEKNDSYRWFIPDPAIRCGAEAPI
jgi:hypothetical protein